VKILEGRTHTANHGGGITSFHKRDKAHPRIRQDRHKTVEFVLFSLFLVMEFAPIKLHLFSWLAFIALDWVLPHFCWPQLMHKGFEGRTTPRISLGLQAQEHRLTVIQVILLDPLTNLLFVGIKHRFSFGPRCGFWLSSQASANRIACDPHNTGYFSNRFP